MSTVEWPDHLLTLDEWEKLSEDERYKVEIAEGVLALSPRPVTMHQRSIRRLTQILNNGLPGRLEAFPEIEVLIDESPPTVRIPDIVVANTAEVGDANLARAAAAQVHLAIEILSDGTRRLDRVTKFAEYAGAGISQYWLVDLVEPVTVTAYVLVDGVYVLDGEITESALLRVSDVEVRLDPAALIQR